MKLALGPLAQLVARIHGMDEVTGSNPVRSTIRHLVAKIPDFSGIFAKRDPHLLLLHMFFNDSWQLFFKPAGHRFFLSENLFTDFDDFFLP